MSSTAKAVRDRYNPTRAIHSQLFVSPEHLSWTHLLSKALLRKYVDVAWDPRANSLPKRIEDNATSGVRSAAKKPLQPSQNTIDQAISLCGREFNAYDATNDAGDTVMARDQHERNVQEEPT